MGVCESKSIDFRRSQEIEDEINKDKRLQTRKLLLLGTGECGKSTILKQMRLLHDSLTDIEKHFFKPIICGHIISSMATIAEAMPQFEISFDNLERECDVEIVKKTIDDEDYQNPINTEVSAAIKRLWNDSGIKQCYTRRDEIHVSDSAKYFFDEIDRITESMYMPTAQDILNVRVATIGVQEVRIQYKETWLRVFDVGGQKSQRRKWIHVFDDVNAIIFITAISEFNQVMKEDNTMNRLLDSLALFNDISNNKYFVNTSMIVFLNKKDLFEEKINQNLSIKSAFNDYQGLDDYDNSIEFIEKKFSSLVEDKAKKIYFHETCANDTNQVQIVLASVTDIILGKMKNQSGF